MTKNGRSRALLIHLLTILSNPQPPAEPGPNACPLCGHEGKCDTGECSHCGTYKCTTCTKYHLGLPSQPCNGMGVDIPGAPA